MKKIHTAIGDRAHLFIDIVGYSKLLINQQRRATALGERNR